MISYGIILFCNYNNKTYFCCYKRRHSYNLIEILLGKWNSKYELRKKMQYISLDEQYKIKYFTYDELWNDLFCGFKKVSIFLKDKYNKYLPFMKNYIKYIKSKQPIIGWSFPKGKPDGNENPMDCALREFEEETSISSSVIELCSKIPTIEHTFKGTNDKYYTSCFFIGKTTKLFKPNYQINNNLIGQKFISVESSDVNWIEINNCDKLLDKNNLIVFNNIINFF